MLHNAIFLTILFSSLLLISLVSSAPTRLPPKGNGFTASLIPPTSPHSPFYNEILTANNIPANQTNIKLDRTHYLQWLLTKRSISRNDYSDFLYNRDLNYYVMDLYIGDPEQLVYAIFDTGSDITWLQCEGSKATKYPYYHHSNSSTYHVVDCMDKVMCKTYSGDVSCTSGDTTGMCEFQIRYMGGDYVTGILSTDVTTLKPTWEILQKFVFGCSNDNGLKIPGIIGASNSSYGIPRQIYPDDPKFSYCIPSNKNNPSFVKFGSDAKLPGRAIKLTANERVQAYFMDVIGFQVNGENIDVDPSVFQVVATGRTGFAIDSGALFTHLAPEAFEALMATVSWYLGKPMKYHSFDTCYPSSIFGSTWPSKPRPLIGIQFRDAAMELEKWVFDFDENNVWHKMPGTNYECLMIHRSTQTNFSVLGAEQMFDVNVGHDPNNNLLYLQKMECPTAP